MGDIIKNCRGKGWWVILLKSVEVRAGEFFFQCRSKDLWVIFKKM